MDEQRYYAKCGKAQSGVEGAIVDLGCWMCSTAISLARGISETTPVGDYAVEKIYAFDTFIWEEWMDRYLPIVSGNYVPGDNFFAEAQSRIASYSDMIELVQEDLTKYTWHGGPIKLLLVDAMKSWELSRAIVSSFYGSLFEGSILIHQDFKHYYTPWIHIVQYRLRDYFNPIYDVKNGGTVAFQTACSIPAHALASSVEFADLSDEEVEGAFQYSIGLVSEKGKPGVAASHVMYFVHTDRPKMAREIFDRYRAKGMHVKGDLAVARREMIKVGV